MRKDRFYLDFAIVLLLILLFSYLPAHDIKVSNESKGSLLIYCSKGPYPTIKEATDVIVSKYGLKIEIKPASPENYMIEIEKTKRGDVVIAGAEYLLDWMQVKGLIIPETRRSLGFRRLCILVAKDNPKGIESLEDLTKEGIKVAIPTKGCLLGIWDEVASKVGNGFINRLRKNIKYVEGCGSLIEAVNKGEVDAGLESIPVCGTSRDYRTSARFANIPQHWSSCGNVHYTERDCSEVY